MRLHFLFAAVVAVAVAATTAAALGATSRKVCRSLATRPERVARRRA
jgi:hypothetical protein